jgi:hypothetical protein
MKLNDSHLRNTSDCHFLILEKHENFLAIVTRIFDRAHRHRDLVNNRDHHQLSEQNIFAAIPGAGILARPFCFIRHGSWLAAIQPRTFSTRPHALEIHGFVWTDARGLQFHVDILGSIQRRSGGDCDGVQFPGDDCDLKPACFQGKIQRPENIFHPAQPCRNRFRFRSIRPIHMESKSTGNNFWITLRSYVRRLQSGRQARLGYKY